MKWSLFHKFTGIHNLLKGDFTGAVINKRMHDRAKYSEDMKELTNETYANNSIGYQSTNTPSNAPEKIVVKNNWPRLIIIGFIYPPVALGIATFCITTLTLSLGLAMIFVAYLLMPFAILTCLYYANKFLSKILDKENISFSSSVAILTLSTFLSITSFSHQVLKITTVTALSLFSGGIILPLIILAIERPNRPQVINILANTIAVILIIATAYIWWMR